MLPNWSVSNFPNFLLAELITVPLSPFITVRSGDLLLAGTIIAAYITTSILVATIRLVKSDTSKRTS